MPYGVSNTRPDCSGWATVKKNSDGSFETVACHDTKQDAIDQMVAVSISEKVEPLGDVSRRSRDEEVVAVDMDETMVTKSRYPIREVVDAVNRLAHRVIVVTGREEAQREQTINDLEYAGIGYDSLLMLPELGQDIAAFKRDAVQELMREYEVIAFIDDNEDNRDAVESLGVYVLTPEEFVEAARESGLFDEDEDEDEPEEEELEFETREVNRVAPGFMAASARRGLRLHEEGHSGDGLMPATVADARRMADGEPLSVAKWRRIPGWIARHMMDLDAVEGDEITPGLVAMLLWGGGSSKSSARRAQAYAERIVSQLEGEERKNQPRDPDGKFASTGGGASAAADGGGDAGGGAAAKPKPKKTPASKKQSGYSKAKPGTESYANGTQKKMREEQASAVGDAVLSSPERAAIAGYAETGYLSVNKSLRGAPPPPLSAKQQESAAKRAATINGVIDKTPPLTAPIVVHRGVRASALGVSRTEDIEGLVGSEFIDKGIVSTSLSPKVANRFVGGASPSVRMQVNVPAGSKAYAIPDELEYFNPMSTAVSFEREVLLPSNTRFKITGFDKKTSTVTVDVVPGDGRAALDDNELRYDPLQPRAPDGKWTSGGGGFSGDVNTGDAGGGAAAGGGSAGAAAGADAPRAPRPGMGDIPLDSHTVMKMRGGSAEKHLVTLPDGTVQFTPEREALHDAIVKDALDGVPPSANPTFHMMGGGAAAGKSSMVRSGAVEVPGKGQAAQLNVDDTRKALPEYGQMTAAGDRNSSAFTHEEASYVTKRAQQAAFERKLDVVLDGTGNSSAESLNKKIDTARANGYEVKGYYATVPIATAIARSDARATNPMSPDFGRFVAPDVLTVQHQSVARVLPAVAPRFDSVRLFDTSGDTPRLLMQGGKGSVTVVDQAGYNAFLAIGGD